jgi:hypothetical protein
MLTLWLAAAALTAQTTTTTPQQQTTTTKASEKITITGCVERADQLAAPGAIGTTTDSLHFVLINSPSAAVGTSGTKPGSGSSMDKGYRLDGDLDTLNPHVGHKVEITGFVDEPATTNGAATSVNGPMVKVQSVKMLAETCGR